MLEALLHNPVFLLFVIIALGYTVGTIKVFGLSLGSSATLFVALVFGHYGLIVPKDLGDLGLILFVYSVGLQAGPRFFKTFRDKGVMFAQIGLLVILIAAILTWAAARLFDIPPPLVIGVFAGALTSTPGLAAAVDTLKDPSVSVGYGIAYPFGVVGVVLFVQILPRFYKSWQPSDTASEEDIKKTSSAESLQLKQYRIENPRCERRTLGELHVHRMIAVNFSRIWHEGNVLPALQQTVLHVGDVVQAVGPAEELSKLEWLLGPETEIQKSLHESKQVIAREVFISDRKVAGKRIKELRVSESYGVVITRVWREDIDMVPTGAFRLEIGDLIRVVGKPEDCENFVKVIGQHEKRIHEITILPFSLGIVLGVLIGYMPIALPGGATAKLGLAGGPLLIGLMLGYFRGLGTLRLRTPYAVRFLLREIGVVFFLAGAGTDAGAHFLEVFASQGISLLIAGFFVTLIPMVVAFVSARYLFQLDLPSALGTVCGSMTSTPGLGAVCAVMDAEEPTLAYATVYPIALLAVTVSAQILSLFL